MQDIILSTHVLVGNVAQALTTYPPTMEVMVGEETYHYAFPYNTIPNVLEYFVSRCVKVAGGTDEDMADLIKQTLTDLVRYPASVNQNLIDQLRFLINFLKARFSEYRCYDEYGTCPYRFIGFVDPSMDVQLRRV